MTEGSDNLDSEKFRLNNVLYYIDYKRKIHAVTEVVSTCESFYTSDVILEAKKLFHDILGDKVDGLRFINRRGENSVKMNLEDLVNALNKCDNDGIELPTFLSSDYSKIPQNNSGNVNLNQILYMMVDMKKQITKLEQRVTSSSDSPTPTAEMVVTTDVLTISSDRQISSDDLIRSTDSLPTSASVALQIAAPQRITADHLSTAIATVMSSGGGGGSGGSGGGGGGGVVGRWSDAAAKPVGVQPIERGNGRQRRLSKSAENRVKTNFSRNKNIVIGKKPSSGLMSWSGANLTVDCYIGRVDSVVASDQIKTDLVAQGIDVINIEENTTRHGLYKSFKMVVRKSDFDKLNSPEFWPEGVVFRRFRRPRPAQDAVGDVPRVSHE